MSALLEDDHAKLYGKRAEEVKYTEERCPFCGSRIDEYGFCACDAGSD